METGEQKDRARQHFEIAISAGRSKQSTQTGFIHYYTQEKDEGVHDTIPIYENMLFCLALLRSRILENMVEAKERIAKLLPFQNLAEKKGNFPTYIHEYPLCYDNFALIHLLPVIFWILKQFSAVIGKELKEQLMTSAELGIGFIEKSEDAPNAPFSIKMKVAGIYKGFGEFFNQKEWVKKSQELFDALKKESEATDFGSWYSPKNMGDILIGLQMAYPTLQNTPWSFFWKQLFEFWHAPSYTYIGPGVKEFQMHFEPDVTLYDFFVGLIRSSFSHRSFEDHPRQLLSVLIQPPQDLMPSVEYPFQKEGEVASLRYHMNQKASYAITLLEKGGKLPPEVAKGYHPLKIVWGDSNNTHTFVLQGGSYDTFTFEKVNGGYDLFFTFYEPIIDDDKEKNREILFFIDQHESTKISVDGSTANTFQINDLIKITSGPLQFSLKFCLHSGEGRFFGHIMPGNRPSQLGLTADNRFTAFDTQIFLRTLRRDVPCQLSVELRIQDDGV